MERHICASSPVEPFELKASDEELEDLRERLKLARWPDQLEGLETGWVILSHSSIFNRQSLTIANSLNRSTVRSCRL